MHTHADTERPISGKYRRTEKLNYKTITRETSGEQKSLWRQFYGSFLQNSKMETCANKWRQGFNFKRN